LAKQLERLDRETASAYHLGRSIENVGSSTLSFIVATAPAYLGEPDTVDI
jgi:hypothetical protein